jgi:hypothetical protein
MKHIKKISDYSIVGGMGALMAATLTGCDDGGQALQPPVQQPNSTFQDASQKQGAFVIIEETAPKQYMIVDEFPSKDTRVVLKTLDGQEKVLTKEEMDALIKEEAAKIDNGTSNLTNPPQQQAQVSGGGMGLGEILLASAAGSILGAWIGNKLFNNQNYQSKRRTSYKSPQTYSRSKNSFNKAKSSASKRSSGYMKKSNSKKSSGFFGSRSGSRSFGG